MLEIYALGGLSIRLDGKFLTNLGSRKAEAILVYLAVEGGEHSRISLATTFWPESPEVNSLTSLRVALSILRKHVGDFLDITHNSVSIRQGAKIYLDVYDLEVKAARRQINQVLDLYRGDLLEGFHIQDSIGFEDWRRWEGERLLKVVLAALGESISDAIDHEDYQKGQELTRKLLKLDNLDELAHQQYMVALALGGKRPAALNHYKECCSILLQELGVEPSWDLRNLHQQILQEQIKIRPQQVFAKHNLPRPHTSFIGREVGCSPWWDRVGLAKLAWR
jgi:DNA-binding SARP family transcriptional activator